MIEETKINFKKKSGYEKFEAEVKETIFAVIFILIKDEEEDLIFSILDAIVELMQLLQFPLTSVSVLLSNSVVFLERR